MLATASVSVVAAPRKPLAPEQHSEHYQDPPSFIFRNESSAAMVLRHGAFTSYQVNVDGDGQNITLDAANEPSIAIDPNDRNRMVIGWRQFDNVA